MKTKFNFLTKTGLFVFSFILPQLLLAQSPPEQPKKGPGGSEYPHQKVKITQHGSDIFDWYWIVQPADPKPDSAEVIIFFHGTNSNLDSTKLLRGQELFVKHIAKKGYTVIYPLYQYGGRTLPSNLQLSNAADVVNLALDRIDSDDEHIPTKRWANGKVKIGVTGISRGGGTSINFATNSRQIGIPEMDAVVAFVPGKGRRHERINPDTKIVIVSAEEDETNGPKAATNAHQQAWDSLYRHPCENKEYFIVHSDDHGTPNIVAKHDCHGSGSDPNNRFRLNTLDFYGSWKWSVGTFNCKFRNTDCRYVFGKDSIAIYMGRWDDGVLVNPSAWVDPCQIVANDDIEEINIIHPNPTSGIIYFNTTKELHTVKIWNSQGHLMGTYLFEKELNVEHLPTGVYHMQLFGEGGQSYVQRLVRG